MDRGFFMRTEEYRTEEYRKKHREYVRKWIHTEKGINSRKRYRKGNKKVKIQSLAQNKINKLITNGKVIRGKCSICGNTKSHAHHEDYSKPFDIIWLCALHHKQRHIELRGSSRYN